MNKLMRSLDIYLKPDTPLTEGYDLVERYRYTDTVTRQQYFVCILWNRHKGFRALAWDAEKGYGDAFVWTKYERPYNAVKAFIEGDRAEGATRKLMRP